MLILRFFLFILAFACGIALLVWIIKYVTDHIRKYEKAVVEKWHDDKDKEADFKIKKLKKKKDGQGS
ncbi:MAG: hypothetical protein ACFFG0_20010 [Candidatus Thorarchaeota archaeon]